MPNDNSRAFEPWDTRFVRQFDEIVTMAPRLGMSDTFLWEHFAALDEDGFLSLLRGGELCLDWPGLFGMTLGEFMRYPTQAQSFEARQRATLAVSAWRDLWRELAGRWPELCCLLQIAYAPGDPLWDSIRVNAYIRLAARVPFKAPSRAVQRAIAARAHTQQRPRAFIQQQALTTALTFVWATVDDGPRRIRFGKSWLKDAKTHRALAVPPGMLRWGYLWKWLCQETAGMAIADLLNKPRHPARPAMNGGDVSDLLAAVRLSPYEEDEQRLEYERMRAQAAEMAEGSGIPPREIDVAVASYVLPAATSAELGAFLGISPATVRVLRHRHAVRKKPLS